MGSNAYLISAQGSTESTDTPELLISMGGMLPPCWLALFEAGDISTKKGNWPLLVADRKMAIARLRRREAHLLSVFGCQTSAVVATFSAKLATLESSTLILDSTEMDMQLSQSAEQWREDLQAMLSAFQSEAQVPVKWSKRLFGGAATSYNAGWRVYFRHFDGMQRDVRAGHLSPQQLAGGSDDQDMPWECL